MAKCNRCHSPFTDRTVVKEYRDDLLGAPFEVIIQDVVVLEKCVSCGEEIGTSLPSLEGLVAAVAIARALHPWKLNGDELRFMRKAAGWKSAEMAAQLDVDKSTMSRWENGKGKPMGNGAEKHLRLAVCTKLGKDAPLMGFDPRDVLGLQIQHLRSANPRLCMKCQKAPADSKVTNGGHKWRIAA